MDEFDPDAMASQCTGRDVDEQGVEDVERTSINTLEPDGAEYLLIPDSGREGSHEFYVETSDGERVQVTEKDYRAASWVEEENWLSEDTDTYVEFGETFARELENYLENSDEDESAERVIAYSAAAGNLVSDYYDREEWSEGKDDVESKFRGAGDTFSAREGGLINGLSQFAGLFNPKSGHGAMNPYHKESDICRNTIESAANTGFAISEDLNRSLMTVGSKVSCQDCIDALESE